VNDGKDVSMNGEERWIRSAAPEMRFEPGFRDRVMARVREIERPGNAAAAARGPDRVADPLYVHLRHAFPRLALAGVIGLVALGAYSLIGGAALAGSPLDALLGLPPETIEAAFALGGV